jgi:uncharacterized repeat protein (TIGR02543 family)
MPAANVVLYAQWTEDAKYTVTYNGNGNTGGTAPVDASSPYYASETVTVEGVGSLVKANHTFTGWNTSADGSGDAYAPAATFTMPAANVVLYAQWTEDAKYTVTYDGNGNTSGTAPVDASSPYYAGETVTVKGPGDLAKENHTFTGWNSEADGSGTAYGSTFTMPAANVILYAQWTEDAKYTVTYNGNGNTGGTAPVDASSPYYAGETVTVEGVGSLVKANHTFTGWNSAPDGSGTAYSGTFTMPAANVILYAQWTEDAKYTVTYDGNGNTGGTAPVDASSPYYAGETVTVEGVGSLVKANHTFAGWNSEADGSGTTYGSSFTMPAANVILYAQWTEDAKYTVTYNGNGNTGGTAPVDASSPYYAGETVTVEGVGDLVKANHTFSGWNSAADGSGTAYSGTFTMPAANVVLYAQWTEDGKYAVTYYGNGADSGSQTDASSPYYAGTEVTVLDQGTFVKANHTFTGWNTQADGEGTAYAATDTFNMPEANVDLFAQWIEDDKYAVTYYGNGADSGSQTDASSPYYAGSEVTVLGQGTLVKANHTFTGWNTQADGEGTAYAATDTFNMPSADVDLFAQWSEDETYTVTYAPGDHGTFAPDVTSGLYIGDATPSAPTPTGESGWIFNGWSPVPTSTVTGNATYVAQWRQPPPPPPQWNPSIAVTITPSETSVEAGSEVTFTMVVSNTGNTVLNNVEVVNEDLDFSTFIPILYVGGSETFTVTKELEIGGTFTVVAEGTSPQVVAVNDTDVTAVEVFIIPPPPPPPPENPPTGAIPFDVYSVSGLLAMGAGLFALITRKKEDDEDED